MKSSEDEIHLYNLSLIPAGVVFAIFLAFFVYFLETDTLRTATDFFWFAIPFWTIIIETVFVSFELLYQRRTGETLNYKRLVGRTILTVLGFISFIAVLDIVYIFNFVWHDEATAVLVAATAWFLMWLLVAVAFKQAIKKLSEGHW